MASPFPLTTNEEFLEITDKDPTVELVGYIDEVTSPEEVGKKIKYQLLKFIVTNGDKKITCLIWGADLISKYVNDIRIYRVVHIDGAQSKAVSTVYLKDKTHFVPFELIIRENTILEFHGIYNVNRAIDETPSDVDFTTINNSTGLVVIKGFVKTVFSVSHSRDKTSSYAVGAITDGLHKVTIQVANFTGSDLVKGDYIVVNGRVKEDDGAVIVQCQDLNDIELDPSVPRMPVVDLIKGVKSAKRQRIN